uniref:BRO1 domain-containing protein n=2 Tax=Sipha flava TaxID=143950 RepID=A0A2S2Q0G0_9HEMI
MGAKYDRRCTNVGGRDDDDTSGTGKPTASSSSTSTGPETVDGAVAAAQCFLRAAGAYRHIGDTFANAPARAADLRATVVLYALMMAQAHECAFERLQWRFLASVRHRCRRFRREEHVRKLPLQTEAGRGAPNASAKRSSTVTAAGGGSNDVTVNYSPSWTDLAREAAHLSRMYGDVVYNSSCRPSDGAAQGSKENGGEQGGAHSSMLPDVWVSVCRIKDRHYAALAYRYAACALLPYYRCTVDSSDDRPHHGRRRWRNANDSNAGELFQELMTAAAAAGLEMAEDDEVTSETMRQQQRCKHLGKLLLEAAAAAHDRAARAQRLCRQLRAKAEWNTSGGGGLLAGVLDRERQRTVRLLLMHRRNDDEYGTTKSNDEDEDDENHCCCRYRYFSDDEDNSNGDATKATKERRYEDYHDCCSDDEGTDAAAVADYCSGNADQEEFTAAGIAGIPGLDVDRGVLIRPRTRFRLMSIAPDFTDTGDGDDDVDGVTTATKQRGGGDDRPRQRQHLHEAADREERRADLFAGLGPVAVFSARHRYTRPRWVKMVRGSRHRSTAVDAGDDHDESPATVDPIQLVDRWFGFELRSHGGGATAAVPPASVGHVRSNSQAQYAGLKRGDIVVELKCTGNGVDRVLDVRWDTCRRVAELIVNNQRRRHYGSGDSGGVSVQLKVVTPITAAVASDGHATKSTSMDPNKMYPRRKTTTSVMTSSQHSSLPPAQMLSQSTSKQRRQRRQTTNSGNDTTDSTNKINTWLWNPFRRRRRSVIGNKC